MNKYLLTPALLAAFASYSSAAIVLQTSELELETGVVQYTVSAVGTEGEQLNTFSNLNLTGNLHQVYNLTFGGPQPTPTANSHGAGGSGFGAGNEAYDTFFKLIPPFAFSNTELVEPLRSPVDTSTTGSLTSLPVQSIFGNPAPTGFNDSLSMSPLNGAITLTSPSASIEFLQVVLAAGEQALLDLRVDGPGVQQSFTDFAIGGVVVDDPMLVGDPISGSNVSLQSVFDDRSDALPGAIMLSNATGDFGLLADLAVGLVDPLGVFDAQLNGDKIDLFINGSVARSLPAGTLATADLTVSSSNGGSLSYTISAVVPEPSTFGLFGLAMVGLAGLRRRS